MTKKTILSTFAKYSGARRPVNTFHARAAAGLVKYRHVLRVAVASEGHGNCRHLMMRALITCLALFLFAAIPMQADAQRISKDLTDLLDVIDSGVYGRQTLEALEEYIEINPGEHGVDEALLRLARAYSAEKDLAKSLETYKRLIDRVPESRFRLEAIYEAALIKYKKGDAKGARTDAESLLATPGISSSLKTRASDLIKEIDRPVAASDGVKAPAIGVLLPLKGEYSRFGEDALKGVLLAADVFGGQSAPVEVIVKETGAEPAQIEKAIDALAADDRVAGVIGPLLSSTAQAAANAAQKKKIPVITLSQKEGVTDAGEYVFRNFLTPSAQAREVAEYACKTLGNKRFAVLYPQNNYGTDLAKFFEKEVRRNGCEVARSASYNQDAADFSSVVKSLFAVQGSEKREGRRKIRDFRPTARVDALYIPDFAGTVNVIIPYLAYYNVKGVQLLGSNGWNSGKLLELGQDVEGAVFVDGFFASSARQGAQDFTGKFKGVYGKTPGVIEAHAYDSAALLIEAMGERPSQDRDEVRKKLQALKNFSGATGVISFNGARDVSRRLFLLTVKNGEIVEAVE